MTWQTRTICTYVAATAQTESTALFDSAQSIGLEDEPEDETTEPEQKTPQPGQAAQVNPPVGSYESFVAAFGGKLSR